MKTQNPKHNTTYSHAFDWIIEAEGGTAHHINDRGGLTRFGISQRAYPHLDIRKLSLLRASAIYLKDYWHKAGCHQVSLLDPALAIALFDAAVNHGSKRAVRMLQRIVGSKADGIFGLKTLGQLNAANPAEVLLQLQLRRSAFYCRIAKRNPSQLIFLLGWQARLHKLRHRLNKLERGGLI